MRTLAILKDSFRETLDCKTFWVLLAVSTLLIAAAFSVSLEAVAPADALAEGVRGFHRIAVGRAAVRHDVEFAAAAVREDGKGGYEFGLRVSPPEAFHRLVRQWDAAARGRVKGPRDPVPDLDLPADGELQRAFLVAQLRLRQLLRVSVEPEPPAPDALSFRVSVRPERAELLHGGHRVGLLFGLYTARLPVSAAMAMAVVHSMVADVFAGFIGLLVAMIVTGMFVPDMLQKGRIDVLLSRPIGRGTLLLSKYLGGLLFVFLNVVYLVGGCWLGLAVRTGNWSPGFLLTIPVLTFLFAVFYGFSVWIAVLTRSSLVAILCTAALWMSSFSAGRFHARRADPQALSVFPGWFEKAVEGIYYLLPKTHDLNLINNAAIARSHLGAEAASTLPQVGAVDLSSWPMAVGSSAVILGAFLACACMTFSRRDY